MLGEKETSEVNKEARNMPGSKICEEHDTDCRDAPSLYFQKMKSCPRRETDCPAFELSRLAAQILVVDVSPDWQLLAKGGDWGRRIRWANPGNSAVQKPTELCTSNGVALTNAQFATDPCRKGQN